MMIESLCAFVVSQPIHLGGPSLGSLKREIEREQDREKERVPTPPASFEYSGGG